IVSNLIRLGFLPAEVRVTSGSGSCSLIGSVRGFLSSGGRERGVKDKKNKNAQLDQNSLDGKDSDDLNSYHTKVTPRNSALNKEDNLHDENDGLTPSKSTANPNKGTSYANLFTGGSSRKAMNFGTLYTLGGNEVDVVVLVESIRAISEQFANTTYGFFLGKRVAYPFVTNYFSSMEGLDAMLENSLWFIRNNLLILKKYNPDVNLLKEYVSNVSVWVKLYGVPVIAFSEDGLSVIATKLGTPLMLDSYISHMCIQSWGRSSYVRALIEVQTDMELKENIMVAMPKLVGERFYMCNVRVEYKWKPPRCASCKVFGHGHDECPKNIASGMAQNLKNPSQAPRGVSVGPKANSSASSFWNMGSSSYSTNPIAKKIDKIKKLIIDGQVTLVGDEGKPVEKVDYSDDHDSEDEVASTDNDMKNFLALEKVGYGQDIPNKIQDKCNNLDIKVRSHIQSMANSFGCLGNNLSLTYLSVNVAANMACINSWNELIQKITIKLSKWKAKCLSVGGAEMDERKMTWACWYKVMAHKQYGGLAFQNPDFAVSLRRRPRGGIEESQFQELSLLLSSIVLSSSSDRWSCTLNGHGDYLVKSIREEIDKHLLVISSSSTR
ncbi:putative reverse transcriptase domain-containing protein, partial [Tanacetum coccineum]